MGIIRTVRPANIWRYPEMNKLFPLQLELIDPDIYDRSVMDGIPFPPRAAAMDQSHGNAMFLGGLIRRYRPKTLLEVGVAAGGSSALLLHILDKSGLASELVSVDLSDRWYKNEKLAVGWAAKKLYPGKKNWHLHTGKFLPEVIEDLNMEFDFCFLDTRHVLPGELLDYLAMLPFMKEDGIVAMHDTALYFSGRNDRGFATRVLIDACVGKKIVPPQNSVDDANLCAFQITPDTYKYVGNIFSALCMPWAYLLDARQFQIYHDFFLRYYGHEAAEWFSKANVWNTAYHIKKFRKIFTTREHG